MRVIEHVEKFGAELDILVLAQRYNFVNSQVDIGRAWAATYGAGRVADLSQGSISER